MNSYNTWGYTYSKSRRQYEPLVPEHSKPNEPNRFFRRANPLRKPIEQTKVCPICHMLNQSTDSVNVRDKTDVPRGL